MARFSLFFIGVLMFQLSASMKESKNIESSDRNRNDFNLKDRNVTYTEKLDDKLKKSDTGIVNDTEQGGLRYKRGYNSGNYYPPIARYTSKLHSSTPNVYGTEDPLIQIQRKLSDIAAIVKQSTLPPVPPATRYPLFVPFVYAPHVDCKCTLVEVKQTSPPPIPTKENKSPPLNPSTTDNMTITIVDVGNRTPIIFKEEELNVQPEIDESLIEDDDDSHRPISFDTVPPPEGIHAVPPPVEHGSIQEDVNSKKKVDFTGAGSFDPFALVAGITRVPPSVEYGWVQDAINSNNKGESSVPDAFNPVLPVKGINEASSPVEHDTFQNNVNSKDDIIGPILSDSFSSVTGIKQALSPVKQIFQDNFNPKNENDLTRPIFPIAPVKDDTEKVEHGSIQDFINDNYVPKRPATTNAPFINKDVQYFLKPETPTICDAALLTCCHQAIITYNCFASRGCPDPTIYKNPCDNKVILDVIDRYQKFYAKKNR